MESTRIFVRGLPPSLGESELRNHFDCFDKKNPTATKLTDAHFIPHRRIGYVGYKTPEAATKAVRFFNRTFIRMSRIVAEIARPIDQDQQKARKRGSDGEAHNERPLKRRIAGNGDETATNTHLTTFVNSLQSLSKGPTWSNEEDIREQARPSTLPSQAESEGEDYQELPKSPNNSAATNAEHMTGKSTGSGSNMPEAFRDDTESGDCTETQPPSTSEVVDNPPASDAEWLRSRTSRILDLLDGEGIDNHIAKKPETKDSASDDTGGLNKPASQDTVQQSRLGGIAQATEAAGGQSDIENTGRLLIRNLLYDTTEEDLVAYLKEFGSIEEIHICCDIRSGQSKGYAFVQFENAEEASSAMQSLDAKPFQGRNLHIEPAAKRRTDGIDEAALSKLSLKAQNQIRRKAAAPTESFRWNSLFMSADAIMSSVATRLGVAKSDVLDPTSADAAVKQAHAETKTIQDTQSYFKRNGVNVDSFNQGQRRGSSENAILVKNFPFGTTASEIEALFAKFGSVKRLLIPPSATIAIVEMEQSSQAKAAFTAVSYSKFKDSVLLLEKAPRNVFSQEATIKSQAAAHSTSDAKLGENVEEEFESQDATASSSLFIDKLPWSVTTDSLSELFKPLDGFLSARVVTRTDPKRPGQILSRGFGFVEFRSKAHARTAMLSLANFTFPGHQPLILRPSQKSSDLAEERRNEDRQKKLASQSTKILIKNLPFEATKKDVRALFSPYGQLRSVRVPKKIDSSSRGFAFADFISAKEASNAIEALRNTHLLGRRLVLDFAVADSIDPEEEIRRMQQKVETQTEKMANSKLLSGSRKKFRAVEDEDQQ